jgi:hypothetical protein
MHGTTIKKRLKQQCTVQQSRRYWNNMHGTTIKKRLKQQCTVQQWRCRVLFQNTNFKKLVHLVGSLIRKVYIRFHCLKYYDYRITSNTRAFAKFRPIDFITKIRSVQCLCLQWRAVTSRDGLEFLQYWFRYNP